MCEILIGIDLLKIEEQCHLSLFDNELRKNWYQEEIFDCEKACVELNTAVPNNYEFSKLNLRKGSFIRIIQRSLYKARLLDLNT